MTEETIEHMASVVEAKGTDAFWQLPVEDLLPQRLRGEAPKLRKQLETMDVWFDSGTSWAGCVESTQGLSFPADLYLEARSSPSHALLCPCACSAGVPACVCQSMASQDQALARAVYASWRPSLAFYMSWSTEVAIHMHSLVLQGDDSVLIVKVAGGWDEEEA